MTFSKSLPAQAGTALITAMFVTLLLFGIAGSYLTLSHGGFETSTREVANVQARIAADDGIQLAAAELKSGVDAGGDGLGKIVKKTGSASIDVTCTSLGGNLYRLHSEAVTNRARTAADVVAEKVPSGSLPYEAQAAISANGAVSTLGNIQVDGRDWNFTGTAVVGPGVLGIASSGAISQGGSSTIGGNGWAPSAPAKPGTTQPNSTWTDGVNNDGDGATDEEAWDGIDNDGDGSIDEDTNGFPTSPDALFSLPPGTLKAAAIASGNYFTTQAAFEAAMAANGNQVPGGKIIYLDFDTWLPAQFGTTLNETPSIIIQHNAAGNRLLKNAHGMFKGLLLIDGVTHLNGDFFLLGAIMSFCTGAPGNAYGNGAARVRLCTAALSTLPSAGGQTRIRIRGWNRSGVN
jgi:hypothetical protein